MFTVRVELSDSLTLQEPWLEARLPTALGLAWSRKEFEAGAEIETNPTGIFKFATLEILFPLRLSHILHEFAVFIQEQFLLRSAPLFTIPQHQLGPNLNKQSTERIFKTV